MLLAGTLLVVLFHLIAALLGWAPGPGDSDWYRNWDTDSYSRLLQVEALYLSGDWYDRSAPWFNAPYGLEMHWSRALDLLLLPGAWLGEWSGDLRRGLEGWSAVVIGPGIQLLFVPLLYWIVAPNTRVASFLLLVAMLLSLNEISVIHLTGFIDYHGLLVLLVLANLGLMLRLPDDDTPSAYPGLLGIVCALGIWLSVEFILLMLPVALLFALFWVIRRRQALAQAEAFGFALVISLALCLVLERPPAHWLRVEYDRLSFLHLLLGGSGYLILMLLKGFESYVAPSRVLPRLLILTACTLPVAGSLLLLFPALLGHPQQELGPFLELLQENQKAELPYFSSAPWLIALLELGPLLWVLPFLAWSLTRGDSRSRQRAMIYLACLLVYLPFLMLKGRAIVFVQIALLLPWWEAVLVTLNAMRTSTARTGVLAMAFVHCLSWIGLLIPSGNAHTYASGTCSIDALAQWYKQQPPHSGTLLASSFQGPQLVYKTGTPVIASPYHRNRQGIEESFILRWMSPDEPGLDELRRQRRVEYVVVCRSLFKFRQAALAQSQDSLLARLGRHEPPNWLEEAPLPPELAEQFLVYRRAR